MLIKTIESLGEMVITYGESIFPGRLSPVTVSR
jgi:hypothetical protein